MSTRLYDATGETEDGREVCNHAIHDFRFMIDIIYDYVILRYKLIGFGNRAKAKVIGVAGARSRRSVGWRARGAEYYLMYKYESRGLDCPTLFFDLRLEP